MDPAPGPHRPRPPNGQRSGRGPSGGPGLVATLVMAAAVVVLILLASNASSSILTAVVQLIVLLAAMAALAWIGSYLWRRGGG